MALLIWVLLSERDRPEISGAVGASFSARLAAAALSPSQRKAAYPSPANKRLNTVKPAGMWVKLAVWEWV